jgi:hypothetical protein
LLLVTQELSCHLHGALAMNDNRSEDEACSRTQTALFRHESCNGDEDRTETDVAIEPPFPCARKMQELEEDPVLRRNDRWRPTRYGRARLKVDFGDGPF